MATPIVVDFTNVKDSSGYNPTHQQAGDYHGKIIKCEVGKSSANQTPMVTYAVQDVDRPSAVYRYNCTITEKSLWKWRNILVAAGVAVPKKKVKIDPDKIVGKDIGISLDDDEYEGKMRSQIVSVFSADDLSNDSGDTDLDGDEEDAPPAKPAKKASAKAAPAKAAKVEEEDEEEDLDELDIDDL